MKIKKGDTVQIISGKDRGKTGAVLKAFPKTEKILVEGVFLHKKHQRPRRARQKGEIITRPYTINISNAMLFCKNCNRGVRIGYKLLGNGLKTRVCKRCKNEI